MEPVPSSPLGQKMIELFPYRWQAIEGLTENNTKARWRTVKRYPLKPRVLWERYLDPSQLVGVRFGRSTTYGVIDIDAGSAYLDQLPTIAAALETIGIVRYIPIRSSNSGGLHLYLPLPEKVATFSLACALEQALTGQGLELKQGQLEIFPNVKSYGKPWIGEFVEYNAHRLPLQPGQGGAILNGDLSPVGDSLSHFFALWDNAALLQDMAAIKSALSVARNNQRKRPRRRAAGPVPQWRADLELEINQGWTGPGQTNGLLKAIACYGRVFEQLEGQELARYVERIAITRPGYLDHCGHQAGITLRAKVWAAAAERYYWPLGTAPAREVQTYSHNAATREDARERIRAAAQQLRLNAPATVRGWVEALVKLASTSQQTLYRHLDLWHPQQGVTAHGAGVIGADAPLSGDSPPTAVNPAPWAVTPDPPPNEGCSLKDLLKNLPLGGEEGGAGGRGGLSTGLGHG